MTFFISWALWLQLSFCLGSAMLITVFVGVGKNIYTWKKNQKYAQMHEANMSEKQDIEAQIPQMDEIPFGIKALQRGIEVEGVWISKTNTPTAGSPVTSARPSPRPSISSSGGSIFPNRRPSPPDIILPEPYTPLNPSNSPRLPSFSAESFRSLSITAESFDITFDFQFEEALNSNGVNSNTLDALEGRSGLGSRTSMDHHSRYRTRSDNHFSRFGYEDSIRQDSPSPPALTDGSSRADTPVSMEARSMLTVLSESSHRLSHVAETGQLVPRTRQIKFGEPASPPSFDHSIQRQSFNHAASSSRTRVGSPRPVMSTRANSYHGMLDEETHLHSPQPLLTVDFDKMTRRSFNDAQNMQSIVKPPTKVMQFPGQLSPKISEELLFNETVPKIHKVRARRSVRTSKVPFSTISVPQPIAQRASMEYRKVNPTFEVRRGTMGSLAVPLELPSLELPPLVKEKRKSRKLQKKRVTSRRSKSLGAMPTTSTN